MRAMWRKRPDINARASVGPERLIFPENGVEIAGNAEVCSPFCRVGLDRADKILTWNDKIVPVGGGVGTLAALETAR